MIPSWSHNPAQVEVAKQYQKATGEPVIIMHHCDGENPHGEQQCSECGETFTPPESMGPGFIFPQGPVFYNGTYWHGAVSDSHHFLVRTCITH